LSEFERISERAEWKKKEKAKKSEPRNKTHEYYRRLYSKVAKGSGHLTCHRRVLDPDIHSLCEGAHADHLKVARHGTC
jgi:hypothetical protein